VRRHANNDADGTKSLIWLYNKYNITPARPGPFYRDKNNVLKKRQDGGSSTGVYAAFLVDLLYY
jgi:hypothetical protein